MVVADESVNLVKDLMDSKELPSYNREPNIHHRKEESTKTYLEVLGNELVVM